MRVAAGYLWLLIGMALAAASTTAAPGVFGAGSLGRAEAPIDAPEIPPAEDDQEKSAGPGPRDFGLAVVKPSLETLRELAPFASLFDIAWDHPDLGEFVSQARSYGMKTLVSVHGLSRGGTPSSRAWAPDASLAASFDAAWAGTYDEPLEVYGLEGDHFLLAASHAVPI